VIVDEGPFFADVDIVLSIRHLKLRAIHVSNCHVQRKSPFIDDHLMKKIEGMNQVNDKKVLRTWSRRSTIHPDFVGHTLPFTMAASSSRSM